MIDADIDLFQVPQKRTLDVWVNVYADGTTGSVRNSKEDADYHRLHNRIACLHIVREYTEGEGL